MQSILRDVHYGFRMLLRRPGFTIGAIVTLGLGIGANAAIFSMVNSVLIRQLPYREADRLVWLWSHRTDRDRAPFSIPDFLDYRTQSKTVERMAAFSEWSANLTEAGDPERLQGVRVSADVFELLGVKSLHGRTLEAYDDRPDSERVVVLTHGLWQRRFGADAGCIGRTVLLNDQSYTVVGVLPAEFIFPVSRAEIAVPLSPEGDPRRGDRGAHFLRAFGRLSSGATGEQAEAEMASITHALREQYPDTNSKKISVSVNTLFDEIVGNYHMTLLLLLGAASLVLLIACSNLANLVLSKATSRYREVAVRLALGASRADLVRQLLTENILLAVLGGCFGLFMAHWGIRVLLALTPADVPRVDDVALDGGVLLFTIVATILSGVVFGTLPAFHTSGIDVNEQLKTGGRSAGSSRGVKLRNLLIVAEVAVSAVLLVAAGLLAQSFRQIQQQNSGVKSENLLVVRLPLSRTKYTKRDLVKDFYAQAEERIKSLPGVESVAASSILPLSALIARIDFTIVGSPVQSQADVPSAHLTMVSPAYLETMGIPILKGRSFTPQDTAKSPGVIVIDQVMANRYFPGDTAVGARLKIDDGDTPREVEIVGVTANVKHSTLDEAPTPGLYVPFYQIPDETVVWLVNTMSLVVRTTVEPMSLASAVKREVQSTDKDVPASSSTTMDQFHSLAVAPRRFNFLLFAVFSATALLLAVAGLYSVVSYGVTERTHEIGIRMALGAKPRDVLILVVGQGFRLVSVGVLLGLIGAAILTRTMSTLLFGVSPMDGLTFVAAAVVLLMVALLASYVPARKAAGLDPLSSLRIQ
jgi:putative ABC transport system permease protein